MNIMMKFYGGHEDRGGARRDTGASRQRLRLRRTNMNVYMGNGFSLVTVERVEQIKSGRLYFMTQRDGRDRVNVYISRVELSPGNVLYPVYYQSGYWLGDFRDLMAKGCYRMFGPFPDFSHKGGLANLGYVDPESEGD